MALRVISGSKGAGKSCLLTKLLFTDWRRGRKILANYHLKFPFKPVNIEEMMKNNSQLYDVTLGIDEAQLYFDCRLSGSKKNRLFSYIMLQTRKRHMDMDLISQQLGNLDIRIRNNLDYLYQCRALVRSGQTLRFATARECDGKVVDAVYVNEYNFGNNTTRKFIFNPKPWFDYFDTDEFFDIEV